MQLFGNSDIAVPQKTTLFKVPNIMGILGCYIIFRIPSLRLFASRESGNIGVGGLCQGGRLYWDLAILGGLNLLLTQVEVV